MRALIVAVGLVLLRPLAIDAQEPHVLSREVQTLALQQPLQQNVTQFFAIKLIAPDPVGLPRYMDTLTTVDVIAAQRAKQRERRNPEQDYQIAFAAICFWPNKPPPSPAVADLMRNVRQRATVGAYLSPKKRAEISNATRQLLLTGNLEEVSRFMSSRSAEEYLAQILDMREIK